MKRWCFIREAGDLLLADHNQADEVERLLGPGRWEERNIEFEQLSLEEIGRRCENPFVGLRFSVYDETLPPRDRQAGP